MAYHDMGTEAVPQSSMRETLVNTVFSHTRAHELLDDLEDRLTGNGPQAVNNGQTDSAPAPPVSMQVALSRSLDGANAIEERLRKILNALG